MAFLGFWGWTPSQPTLALDRLDGNAMWASVDWTSQPVDAPGVRELAALAIAHNVRYVLPYTTYVRSDGGFSPSFDHAAEFVAQFHDAAPDVRLLAWIGVPLASRYHLGVNGSVDLADAATRGRIAAFSGLLVQEYGFDGIHLDAETVWDGDDNFLMLLDEVRAAIGPGRILSVAGAHWAPPLIRWAPVLGKLRWGSGYYREVVARVDQIATMTYDSYMPVRALYRLWLREQVLGLSGAVAGSNVELLIGLSASRENTISHRPTAENTRSGLAGASAGIEAAGKAGDAVQGLALYASWEATADDWAAWDMCLIVNEVVLKPQVAQ